MIASILGHKREDRHMFSRQYHKVCMYFIKRKKKCQSTNKLAGIQGLPHDKVLRGIEEATLIQCHGGASISVKRVELKGLKTNYILHITESDKHDEVPGLHKEILVSNMS